MFSLNISNERAKYELLQPNTDDEISEDESKSNRFCPNKLEDNSTNPPYMQPDEVIVIDSDDENADSDEPELDTSGNVKSDKKDVILPGDDNAGEILEQVEIIDLRTPPRENHSSVSQYETTPTTSECYRGRRLDFTIQDD